MVCDFSFSDNKDKEKVVTGFIRELHLVDELKAKILVRLDITGPKGFVMNLLNKIAILKHCESAEIPIVITSLPGLYISKPMCVQSNIVVPLETTIMVPIHHLDLLIGRDFVFEPDSTPLTLYAH